MALPATPPESWADNSPKLGLFNQGNTIIVKMRKYIEHRHAKVFQNFSRTQSDLVTQLSNTNSFILPAGGTFFYCNPVLNYDGALLCNIFYNDNEGSAAKPNPNAPARKVVVVTPVLAPRGWPSSLAIDGKSSSKAVIRRYQEERNRLTGVGESNVA